MDHANVLHGGLSLCPAKAFAPARRNPRPEFPRRARSARCRPREQRSRIDAQRLQALPQHLAALAEGRLGHLLQGSASQASGAARGTSRTTDDVTLGGGTKAEGATSNRIFASHASPPAPTAGRRSCCPARRRCARPPRAGTSAPAVVPGRPRLGGQPADQQRGRDVVGQVGDDARARAAQMRARIEARARRPPRSRAGPDSAPRSRPAPRIARSSRSMAITRLAPCASSARVRPPGPGPTSTTVAPSSGPAARAMRAVRLRSSRKFWPSDFLAERPCRRITSRSGGRSSICAISRALSYPPPAQRRGGSLADALASASGVRGA